MPRAGGSGALRPVGASERVGLLLCTYRALRQVSRCSVTRDAEGICRVMHARQHMRRSHLCADLGFLALHCAQ